MQPERANQWDKEPTETLKVKEFVVVDHIDPTPGSMPPKTQEKHLEVQNV